MSGQITIDGGPGDVLNCILRKYDNSAAYVEIGSVTRNVSNLVGGADVAIFVLQYPVTLDVDDRVELWIENTTDGTDATVLEGSYLVVDER